MELLFEAIVAPNVAVVANALAEVGVLMPGAKYDVPVTAIFCADEPPLVKLKFPATVPICVVGLNSTYTGVDETVPAPVCDIVKLLP